MKICELGQIAKNASFSCYTVCSIYYSYCTKIWAEMQNETKDYYQHTYVVHFFNVWEGIGSNNAVAQGKGGVAT